MASDEEYGISDLFREEVAEENKGGKTGGNRSVRSLLMAPGFTKFDLEKFMARVTSVYGRQESRIFWRSRES